MFYLAEEVGCRGNWAIARTAIRLIHRQVVRIFLAPVPLAIPALIPIRGIVAKFLLVIIGASSSLARWETADFLTRVITRRAEGFFAVRANLFLHSAIPYRDEQSLQRVSVTFPLSVLSLEQPLQSAQWSQEMSSSRGVKYEK